MSNPSRSNSLVVKVCTWLLLSVGILALFYLLKLRFDTGDTMPRGSTLRSDPLGMEVLFESLNSSGLATAERNYQSLQHCDLTPFDMVFISQGNLYLSGASGDALQHFVTNNGGRLLITLPPQAQLAHRSTRRSQRVQKAKPPKKNTEEKDATAGEDEADHSDDLPPAESKADATQSSTNTLWLAIDLCALQGSPESATLNPEFAAGNFDLPPTLPIKTRQGLATNILAEGWTAVYLCGDIPMVAQRDFGPGRVTISALSFPFSNEAMRDQRATDFLLWAFQGTPHVLFDESHFGLVISRTVAKLIRKNNLHYALLGLLLPAVLYFWLAALPLLPRYDLDSVAFNEKSPASGGGLCNLLTRSIPSREIVSAALESWRSNNSHRLRDLPEGLVEQLLTKNRQRARRLPREHEIVAAYNEAVDRLKEKS